MAEIHCYFIDRSSCSLEFQSKNRKNEHNPWYPRVKCVFSLMTHKYRFVVSWKKVISIASHGIQIVTTRNKTDHFNFGTKPVRYSFFF